MLDNSSGMSPIYPKKYSDPITAMCAMDATGVFPARKLMCERTQLPYKSPHMPTAPLSGNSSSIQAERTGSWPGHDPVRSAASSTRRISHYLCANFRVLFLFSMYFALIV